MYLDLEANGLKTVQELHDNNNFGTWNIWLELIEPGVPSLIPFNKNNQSLIFFKLFIPEERLLVYCGYSFVTHETLLGIVVLFIFFIYSYIFFNFNILFIFKNLLLI